MTNLPYDTHAPQGPMATDCDRHTLHIIHAGRAVGVPYRVKRKSLARKLWEFLTQPNPGF